MMTTITSVDLNILVFIREYLANPILDKIMIFVSALGDIGLIWIAIGLFLLINKKYRKIGVLVLVALLLEVVIVDGIIKNIVQRHRPFLALPGIELLIKRPLSYSFPSGHTASSFAAAVVLAKYFRKYRYGIYCFATLMGISRMYLFVHYPTDVFVGAIIGISCGVFVLRTFKKT